MHLSQWSNLSRKRSPLWLQASLNFSLISLFSPTLFHCIRFWGFTYVLSQCQSTVVKMLNSKQLFNPFSLALQLSPSFPLSYKPITCQFPGAQTMIITTAHLYSVPRTVIKFISGRTMQLIRDNGYANVTVRADLLFLAAQWYLWGCEERMQDCRGMKEGFQGQVWKLCTSAGQDKRLESMKRRPNAPSNIMSCCNCSQKSSN